MKKLPDFEAWAIFAKVAQTGSFARAALELGVSQATVSKAIARLETRMKAALFHRTSRRIALSETGRSALEGAARLLSAGESVESEVAEQSEQLNGLVRLALPMSFGLAHIAPLLPEFLNSHPEITLDVHFGDAIVDLVGQGFDLAVRIATLADSTLRARRLCVVQVLLVGSPAYFARYGRPTHPRELAVHHALIYTQSRAIPAWRFQHAEKGDATVDMRSQLLVNNAEALAPSLCAGLGLALQPEFLVWQDLQDGRLERAMPEWQAPSIAVHLVTPSGRLRPARVQAVINFLAQRLAEAPWARAPSGQTL